MGWYFRVFAALGWWAIAASALACQSASSGAKSAPCPASIWSPHLGSQAKSNTNDEAAPVRYRGALFALRAHDVPLSEAVWVRCPLEVQYRYESLAPQSEVVDVPDLETLMRLFPAAHDELRGVVESGEHVRVTYVVSGRFVIDVPSPRAPAIVCPAATHYVRAIAVGAYRVEVGGDPLATDDDGVTRANKRSHSHGRPAVCEASESTVPRTGCAVPLAYALSPIPGHDPNRKLRANETAPPDNVPSTQTMPGVLQRPVTPAITADFEDCFIGFRPTGDAKQDLSELTRRCGAPTGMVPHSEVFAGWQAVSTDIARYQVPVEAGQCYRAFGVGGEGVRDLDMGLHGPDGRLVARDVRPDEWAIVSPDSPVCVQQSADYELVVSVEAGQGPFAVQVWRLDR